MIQANPWPDDMLTQVHAELFGDEIAGRAERHQKRLQEYGKLQALAQGELQVHGKDFEFRGERYAPDDVAQLIKKVERELKKDGNWLSSLDRKVFLTYYQMALRTDGRMATELEERYRFHLATQDILQELSGHQGRVGAALAFLSGKRELTAEQFRELHKILRNAHRALSSGLSTARNLLLPPLKNIDAGQPLQSFLLKKCLVYEPLPDDDSIDGEWIGKFWEQLGSVQDNGRRILSKSLGGILSLQEIIGKCWSRLTPNVPTVVPVNEREPAPIQYQGRGTRD